MSEPLTQGRHTSKKSVEKTNGGVLKETEKNHLILQSNKNH